LAIPTRVRTPLSAPRIFFGWCAARPHSRFSPPRSCKGRFPSPGAKRHPRGWRWWAVDIGGRPHPVERELLSRSANRWLAAGRSNHSGTAQRRVYNRLCVGDLKPHLSRPQRDQSWRQLSRLVSFPDVYLAIAWLSNCSCTDVNSLLFRVADVYLEPKVGQT
jgi:hypothetical protein